MEFSFITFYKKASSQTLLWLAFGAALNAAKQVYPYLMKELLKLFPILGLASLWVSPSAAVEPKPGMTRPPLKTNKKKQPKLPKGQAVPTAKASKPNRFENPHGPSWGLVYKQKNRPLNPHRHASTKPPPGGRLWGLGCAGTNHINPGHFGALFCALTRGSFRWKFGRGGVGFGHGGNSVCDSDVADICGIL